jgi:hypothetical protein
MPDLRGRLPKEVGSEASWGARHTAPEWEPLQKLDKVERAERIVVSRPLQGMTV